MKLISVVCFTMLFMTAGLYAGEIHEAVAAGDLDKFRTLIKADPTLLESKDDMPEILDFMKHCHGLLIGSPVYFGMVSGQLKTMMDRCVVMRPSYGDPFPMTGKIGGAIACANARNGGQEIILQNIQTFMLQLNMQVISDGPSYSHSGATIAAQAKDDSWGLETVHNLAMNMARMLKRK